ncbi:MAG: hypothetical protein ACYC4B_06040 [Pirellulaceae bacterium]
MSEIIEDRDRQVVPRWRSFMDAANYGEVAPLKQRRSGAFDARMLQHILDDWRREPGLSVGSDLVSAAFSIGCTAVARDAAKLVLEHENSTPVAREIARRYLADANEGPSADFIQNYFVPMDKSLHQAIHSGRVKLREYPFNPLLWTNLALLYTVAGLEEKANQAMKVALGLVPESRFVLRAACRLFLHQGDPEHAHWILLKSAAVKSDPWVLASEVAVAAAMKRSSTLIKKARYLVESQNHAPFHLSELTGALATIEANNGKVKKARHLSRLSMREPAENAIAQVGWLNRHVGGFSWGSDAVVSAKSNEADAFHAHEEADWENALTCARKWHREQPFSSRPAILSASVASTVLEDFSQAEEILMMALVSNRDDATIYNNLAFALAKQDRVDEATKFLEQGWQCGLTPEQKLCLTATKGLIAYRSSKPVHGRNLYQQAINMASSVTLNLLSSVAKVYFAIEESRVNSSEASKRRREAMDEMATFPKSLAPVFRQKLERAAATATSEV